MRVCMPARSGAGYLLQWEATNLLLAMASTQLYTPTATAAAGAHPFTAAMLEQHDLVPGLLQVGAGHWLGEIEDTSEDTAMRCTHEGHWLLLLFGLLEGWERKQQP